MTELAATMTNHNALSSISDSLLEEASRIANGADTRLRNIRTKILRLCLIGLIGLIGAGAAVFVILAGYPESQAERLLTTFALCGSISIVLASLIGVVIVSWSAYVYQYVKALDATSEAEEATDQAHQLLSASASLSTDPQFEKEIVEAIVELFLSTINDPDIRGDLKKNGVPEMLRHIDERSLHSISSRAAVYMMRKPQNALLKRIDHAVITHFSRFDERYEALVEEERSFNDSAMSFAN